VFGIAELMLQPNGGGILGGFFAFLFSLRHGILT
jgi:hypothetical protein